MWSPLPEENQLKSLVLNEPVVLNVTQPDHATSNLHQFSIMCAEKDKFLITFALLKLKIGQYIPANQSIDWTLINNVSFGEDHFLCEIN